METSGHIERVAVPSALLEGTLWVSVYTPPCCSEQPEAPYPVLYLLHGQGQDDSLWPGLGIQAIVDEAIVAGQQPFLIVMPFEERNFDAVGDSKFPAAVMQELLPWVEANYPTCTERACRAIGGISRGGGWAVNIALRNFDTFGAVGAHSMGLMPGDWWYVSHLLETHTAAEFPRIYMDRGENDFLAEDIDLFESALTDGGIAHEFHIWPGQHELAYWQAHVAEYLHWYMQGWQ
jgi:enterochelin esterase-like enzyme